MAQTSQEKSAEAWKMLLMKSCCWWWLVAVVGGGFLLLWLSDFYREVMIITRKISALART